MPSNAFSLSPGRGGQSEGSPYCEGLLDLEALRELLSFDVLLRKRPKHDQSSPSFLSDASTGFPQAVEEFVTRAIVLVN